MRCGSPRIGDRLGRVDVEGDAALLGAEQEPRLRRAGQLGQVDRIALQRQVARLDAAQVQQVFDQPAHALGFLADDAAGLARALGARDACRRPARRRSR